MITVFDYLLIVGVFLMLFVVSYLIDRQLDKDLNYRDYERDEE